MSARSRALDDLADHCERLARQTTEWDFEAPAVYTGTDVWAKAADMARRTALSERWRERIARRLRIPWP